MESPAAQCLIQLNGQNYSLEVECLEVRHYRHYPPAEHVHPAYHFILISQGGNLAQIAAQPAIELKLHSLLFINPLVPHRFTVVAGGEVEHTSLIWRFRDTHGAYALFPLQRLRGLPDAESEPYRLRQISAFDAALFRRKHQQALAARSAMADGFGFSMLAFELFFLGLELVLPKAASGPQDPHKQLVARLKTLIEQDVVRPELDIPRLAAQVQMHPNYINTVFKRHEGVTLNHYIRDRRIELAKSIIRSDSRRPLAAVARMCGFSQHGYFTRTFRKLCNCTPAEYRATAGE